jgi:hypothetical protein
MPATGAIFEKERRSPERPDLIEAAARYREVETPEYH